MRQSALARCDRWAPLAFMLGGLGLLGTSAVGTLDVAGVVQTPPRLDMGPLLFGLWFVFVGLIGLYPRVADETPRLALGGGATAGLGWVVWSGTMLAVIGIDLTSDRSMAEPGAWAPPLLVGAFLLALLSFLLYGLASTWTERPSRTVGLLLLLPVGAFLGQAVLLASKILTGEVVAVLQLALGAVAGVALVLVGSRLRTAANRPAGGDSRPEPAT